MYVLSSFLNSRYSQLTFLVKIPPLLRQIIEAAAAAEAQQQHQQATPRPVLEPSTKEQSQPQQLHPAQASRSPTKPTDASTKILSSSASKPPPTHPILKKARGPSSSGPRPTARFISPQESAEEDEKESEFPSSGSTIATDNRAYITSPTKKTFNSTKKFVASTTAAKRRPLLPRRQSSQTSGNTEAGTRESGSSAGSKHAGNSTAKQVNSQAASASDDSSSSVPTERPAERPTISAKAAGKRPAVQRRRTSEKKHLTKQEPRPPVAPIRSPPAEPVRAAALTQARSMVNLPGHSRTASGKDLPSSALSPEAPTMMARAQSHTGYEHRRETSIGRAPLQGLFTGATASTTNVAAQGTILDQSGLDTTALPGMLDQHRQRHMIPGQSPSSSLLDSRFTPTQPTTLGSVPLGRTKSQLTLLLERENAKIGNRPRSKS